MIGLMESRGVKRSAAYHWLPYIFYGSLLLYLARDVFVPLSVAVLLSFILYPFCTWLENRGLSRGVSITIALTLLFVLIALLVALLVSQFMAFVNEWPALKARIGSAIADLSAWLADVFGLSPERQRQMLTRVSDQSGSNLLLFVRNALSASAFSAVLLFLTPVYVVLILYHRRYWLQIFYRLFPQENVENLRTILSLTVKTYYNFVKGMAVVYFIVGVLNSIGLWLLGIPHPLLFGFVASILTFVPYIGIIVGSLLPIAMAWITYDSFWYPAGIVAVFAFVQYLEANVIFPFAVSARLNVNTLVMLLAIFIGGLVWGVAGMILFVPFVGIAKLVADYNPEWKTLAMLLGTGEAPVWRHKR